MLGVNKGQLLDAFEAMNNKQLPQAVDLLSQIHNNLVNLCDTADQSIAQAEKTGQISNALYVLREERELISKNDFADYVLNHPECHFLYDK